MLVLDGSASCSVQEHTNLQREQAHLYEYDGNLLDVIILPGMDVIYMPLF